nr:hypothetical protein [Tanacetum cinerariifolium]
MSNVVNGSLRTCINLTVAYLSSRTMAYMEVLTIDAFIISKRFVSVSLTYRVTSKRVAVASTSSKAVGNNYLSSYAWLMELWHAGQLHLTRILVVEVASVVAVVLFPATTTVKNEAGGDTDSYGYVITCCVMKLGIYADGNCVCGRFERHRRSRSVNNGDFELQESRCLQRPMVQSSKWLAERIPEFARLDHDDLYRVIDIYLKTGIDLCAEEWSKENKDKPVFWYGEAWASGQTLREISMDCAIGEGSPCQLLRLLD